MKKCSGIIYIRTNGCAKRECIKNHSGRHLKSPIKEKRGTSMKKKILSGLLSLAMSVSLLAGVPQPVMAETNANEVE